MSALYTVVFSKHVDEQLDVLEAIAVAEGRGEEFADALEKCYQSHETRSE